MFDVNVYSLHNRRKNADLLTLIEKRPKRREIGHKLAPLARRKLLGFQIGDFAANGFLELEGTNGNALARRSAASV
jgi:hypothetical protein